MSYPIFAERLGVPVLEGLAAVEDFKAGFCRRWSDPTVTVHDVVESDGAVALIWSYSATSLAGDPADGVQATQASWGGISVFHFDESGRVLVELGEESTPGPHARMEASP